MQLPRWNNCKNPRTRGKTAQPSISHSGQGLEGKKSSSLPVEGGIFSLTFPFIDQAITRTEASAAGEKARAYIRLFSGLRANHSNQGRRSGDVDAVTFPTAHNRTANGIQLELPPGGKVFLHRAAYTRGQAVIDRLDLGRVNFRAACFRHSTGLSHGGNQFVFPLRVRVDLPFVHA